MGRGLPGGGGPQEGGGCGHWAESSRTQRTLWGGGEGQFPLKEGVRLQEMFIFLLQDKS